MVFAADAGFDDEFTRASDLGYYPGIANPQSAQLVVNLTYILHRENLQIIQTLQDLQERLNRLETSINTIEREIVGK
jgi:hypothetical protein